MEDERSTPTPQVGTCHPTATIREGIGWQPVPPELPHTPGKERRAEYSCLMTGQENERGAPYSNFETNCPNVEKGKRVTPSAGGLFVFPQQTTGKGEHLFETAIGGRYG